MKSKSSLICLVAVFGGFLAVMGCHSVPLLTGTERASIGYKTAVHDELISLPEPRSKTVVAVYKFRDQTGQYKTSAQSTTFSTAVSQGATSILNKALEDSGWFTTIEREGLHNLLNERNIIRSTRLAHGNGSSAAPLPPMLYAGVLLEGGIISYDTNIFTGGAGIHYFGAGGSGKIYKDQVTVYLRLISVKTGEILKNVTATKSILSRQVDLGVYRFVRENRLLEMEGGYTTNEPSSLCLLEAIEKAVLDLIIDGIQDGIWQLANPEDLNSPIIQDYLQENGYLLDQDETPNQISESAGNWTRVGISIHATKRNASGPVRYSLYDDAEGRFQIDPKTGIVTVKDQHLLDSESKTTHRITAQGTFSDGSLARQSFVIRLTDDTTERSVNSMKDVDTAPDTVRENVPRGTPVGITVLALDQDLSDTVTYTLVEDANERFQIDPSTGIVTVDNGGLLDYETCTAHNITARASSTDGSWKVESFAIQVIDDNQEFSVASLQDTATAANEIRESAPINTPVGITAHAVDADATDTVSYTLADDGNGRFQIDPHSGIVSVKNAHPLDAETQSAYAITVRATSTDGSSLTQTFTVNVINDVVENAPDDAAVDPNDLVLLEPNRGR